MNLRGKVTFTLQSLTSGTTYNVFVCAAPAQQVIAIEGFGWFGAANAAQTPGNLIFNRASSAGTGGTSLTPKTTKQDYTETFQSTWTSLPSGAPSSIVEIDERLINPQIGQEVYVPGQISYEIKGGGFFVVQFTPQWTGNYNGWLYIAE